MADIRQQIFAAINGYQVVKSAQSNTIPFKSDVKHKSASVTAQSTLDSHWQAVPKEAVNNRDPSETWKPSIIRQKKVSRQTSIPEVLGRRRVEATSPRTAPEPVEIEYDSNNEKQSEQFWSSNFVGSEDDNREALLNQRGGIVVKRLAAGKRLPEGISLDFVYKF